MEVYTHKQIHDLLIRAKKPVFITDERIDGDCLGSALAVVDYMKGRGIKVPVYVPHEIPETYLRLPHIGNCGFDMSVFHDRSIDLIVTFDCSDHLYIKKCLDQIPGKPMVINIDHHKTNPLFGDVNQVLVDSPATCEVIYQFFKVNQIIPSREAATCLLTGIAFDTTLFTNDGANAKAFDASSDLVLYGARVQEVIRIMFKNRSVSALRIWGAALERLRAHSDQELISTYLTQEDIQKNNVTDEEVAGLSDFLNIVMDMETLFVLFETKSGHVKVSMRSASKDVSEIAASMGGGGHAKAAGFSVPNTKITCDEKGCWQVVDSNNMVKLHQNMVF